MGLFDFALDVGKKIFKKGDNAATKIEEHIAEDNPGIEGLQVAYDESGKVSISGTAASAEALEKAVLMAGNIAGVADVDASGVTAPAATVEVEYYTIAKGDTLSAIAKKFYGKASDYPRIFEANREVIKDPNLIFPGQKIRIPKA
ncbi:MAG: peptidoglycan-binding protein LysM [Thiotrichales bacterium]